jgi:Ribonuclease G/E
MPAVNLQAQEDARAFMKRVAGIEVNTCPNCQGRWRVVEQRGADFPALRGLLPERGAPCRGPP